MPSIDTIVIGAGQAGLAASRHLGERGIEHVVLERGRIAERWLSERWDSLRLLTPNWMSRLPGFAYDGPEPNGFMTASELAAHLHRYAVVSSAPVAEDSSVLHLGPADHGFRVITTRDAWSSTNVIIATGWTDKPAVPAVAHHLDRSIAQVVPAAYRNPGALPDGGVLVVGASATGVQLADELAAAGRDVVLAVGSHTRLPRSYRGMDIFWWLERIGNFDRTIDEVPDPIAARREPSAQLVGRPDHRSLDLGTLQAMGVQLVGRLVAVSGPHVRFATDLPRAIDEADVRMQRTLNDIDAHIEASGLRSEVLDRETLPPIVVTSPRDALDLRARGIRTVIWATGHRRTYPWLHLPALDERGEIRHHRGVTPLPGLYVLGQRFQHYRNSNFIDGVGRDAAFVVEHLATVARTLTPHR